MQLIMEQIVPYMVAGRKCPPVQLQSVRTSTGAIGVHNTASKCYLHKGMYADVKGLALMQAKYNMRPRRSQGCILPEALGSGYN